MRHLGILAHSVEGASLCLRTFAQHGFRELGPHDHPDVTLDCIALARSMPAYETGDHASIRDTMSESGHRLAAAGAEFFACPDNTVHEVLELPGPALALPGLHIADVLAEHAATNHYRQVGVLGTKYLMNAPVYPRALGGRGIAVDVPDPSDQEIVNAIIFDELVNGIITERARREHVRVIDTLAARGCDAVALACTEIPLLINSSDSPLPTLDSTRLLAAAAFEVATHQRRLPSWRGGPHTADAEGGADERVNRPGTGS
jgi:aspartate racemase